MKDVITAHLNDPEALEKAYRTERREFAAALPQALVEHPDAPLLRAFKARFASSRDLGLGRSHEFYVVTGLALLAGLVFKLPEILPALDTAWFYPRVSGQGVIWGLVLYLLWNKRWPRPHTWAILAATAALSVWYLLIPLATSDAWALSWGHTVFLVWLVQGAAFAGLLWPKVRNWSDYFRYIGEQAILCVILFLGGAVLAIMTYGLFELLGFGTEWILDWMVVFGAAAIPVVAAHLTLKQSSWRLAPLVARVFAPLFLLLCVGYLLTMLFVTGDIFVDRDSLLLFNCLLAVVLALAVFCMVGRAEGEGGRGTDWVVACLVAAALVLDVVALWAILGRMFSMGATANRVAVTGGNLVMLGHLAVLVCAFARSLAGKGDKDDMELASARYLPVYAVWTTIMAFIFPFIF